MSPAVHLPQRRNPARHYLGLAIQALQRQRQALAFDANLYEAHGIPGEAGEFLRAAIARAELHAAIEHLQVLRRATDAVTGKDANG